MGNESKKSTQSRRGFLSLLTRGQQEKVKLLTADGKLVEVDKAVLDQVKKNQKATNKEILQWMNNPSKEKD